MDRLSLVPLVEYSVLTRPLSPCVELCWAPVASTALGIRVQLSELTCSEGDGPGDNKEWRLRGDQCAQWGASGTGWPSRGRGPGTLPEPQEGILLRWLRAQPPLCLVPPLLPFKACPGPPGRPW